MLFTIIIFCNLYFLNISTQKLSNTYLKNTTNIKICMIECIPILLIVNYQSSHKLAGKKAQLIKVQAQELDFRSPGSTAKQGAVGCPCNSSTVRVLRGGSQRFIGQPSQTGKLWIQPKTVPQTNRVESNRGRYITSTCVLNTQACTCTYKQEKINIRI